MKKRGGCLFAYNESLRRSLRTPLCMESGRYYELELQDHVHRLETQQNKVCSRGLAVPKLAVPVGSEQRNKETALLLRVAH